MGGLWENFWRYLDKLWEVSRGKTGGLPICFGKWKIEKIEKIEKLKNWKIEKIEEKNFFDA